MELGPVGVWWSGPWRVEGEPGTDVAAELEALGYGCLWSSGGFETALAPHFARLLASTSRVPVASGVLSVWSADPEQLLGSVADLGRRHPGRFLLGLGASHAAFVPGYTRPLSRMVRFLDALDGLAADGPDRPDGGAWLVGRDNRVLAALGPRMLALAAERALGAHPYFVPVAHTARARAILGPGAVLAPELTAVLDSDAERARALARSFTSLYLSLPNYAGNLVRLGYDEVELVGGGSDRLVDDVVAWGDAEAVARRVRDHLDAGADHVCVQVLTDGAGFPLDTYRDLARALPA